MKRETREWLILSVLILMKALLLIIAILLTSPIWSQDSIQVKIIKIKGEKVIMKTIERPRIKFITYCKSPYRVKEILWIKQQQVY